MEPYSFGSGGPAPSHALAVYRRGNVRMGQPRALGGSCVVQPDSSPAPVYITQYMNTEIVICWKNLFLVVWLSPYHTHLIPVTAI